MSASASPRRRWSGLDRRGTTSLEFALVGSLLMSLLLGSIEVSRYMFTLESMRVVVSEAVRLATLQGSRNMNAGSAPCTNLSGPLAGAGAQTPFLDAALLTVAMSGCVTHAGTTRVTIKVSYEFTVSVPLLGTTKQSLTEMTQAVFN